VFILLFSIFSYTGIDFDPESSSSTFVVNALSSEKTLDTELFATVDSALPLLKKDSIDSFTLILSDTVSVSTDKISQDELMFVKQNMDRKAILEKIFVEFRIRSTLNQVLHSLSNLSLFENLQNDIFNSNFPNQQFELETPFSQYSVLNQLLYELDLESNLNPFTLNELFSDFETSSNGISPTTNSQLLQLSIVIPIIITIFSVAAVKGFSFNKKHLRNSTSLAFSIILLYKRFC